jgi:hypothetical protein
MSRVIRLEHSSGTNVRVLLCRGELNVSDELVNYEIDAPRSDMSVQ